jgi:hypothetical protein
MAIQFGRVPIITEPAMDMQMLVQLVNFRIDEFNRALYEVELEIAKLEGLNDYEPTFHNHMNMQNLRIKNVARSREPQDVVTRRELEEIGLFGNLEDAIRLTVDLIVDGDLIVTGGSGGGSSVVTNDDLEETVDEAIENNVATSVDGDLFVREDAAGINGTTPGTVAMGVDGEGKVRPVELREGQLPVYDSELRELIKILIEEVRLLRDEN